MAEESKPAQADESAQGGANKPLAEALEMLIASRSTSRGVAAAGGVTAEGAEALAGIAGQCPDEEEWALLLVEDQRTASSGSQAADALLTHAALCANCAEKLRIFSSDLSVEEVDLLGQLGTSSAEGQRDLARQLAGSARARVANATRPAIPIKRSGNRTSRHYLWTGAGVAAALLIGVGLVAWWRLVNSPARLLAAAYTQSRSFDLRIPGAGYAEIKPQDHLRGGKPAAKPAKLMEAIARIDRHLNSAPGDPQWLEFQARADVLEERFDPAIDTLDKLVAAGPVTADLLLDDASAYFERGQATGSENDRSMALELLRHADELAPDDPVVLFNEALVLEDQGQLMSAVETWNRYLRFERDPRWQAEGQRRLKVLEEKLNELRSQQRLKSQ
jgi:tetratricopeptide (TPR) repeat protein